MKLLHFIFTVILTLTITFLVQSCRKEDVRTSLSSNSLILEPPAHCQNGIYDEDELGIDCGGSCAECVQFHGSCTTQENKVTINPGGNTVVVTTPTCSVDENGREYIKGFCGSGKYITVTFSDEISVGVKEVSLGPNPSPGEVAFRFYNQASTLYNSYNISSSAKVYVSTIGSGYSVEFCNMKVHYLTNTSNALYTLYGDITCN